MSEAVKLERSIEHAWRYFELHAQQRMTVFNFFLAISGLVAAGVGVGIQQGEAFNILVSLLGCFLMLISFIFWKLDQRVSAMIKQAEAALCYLEGQSLYSEVAIFSKEIAETQKRSICGIWTYGRCFRLSFFLAGLMGCLFVLAPYFLDLSCRP